MVIKYLRIALTLLLIGLVWRHAHWSVALTLTLITVNTELVLQHFDRQKKYKYDRGLTEYNLFNKIKKLTRRTESVEKQTEYANRQLQSITTKQSTANKTVLDIKPNSPGQK